MKDDRGLYYYPNPLQKKFRMYVKEMHGEICFRMWNSEDPELWKTHGWVPYGAIREAAAVYDGKSHRPQAGLRHRGGPGLDETRQLNFY